MIGLLDTHVFLWWATDPAKLSAAAAAFIRGPANLVMISVVSVWEMQIKMKLGKLQPAVALSPLVAHHQASGMLILPVHLAHIYMLDGLPTPHKDPFDRLLAAQAIVEGAYLVTADPVFAQYPVSVLW